MDIRVVEFGQLQFCVCGTGSMYALLNDLLNIVQVNKVNKYVFTGFNKST